MNTIEIKVILNLSLSLSHSHLILYDLDSTILLAQLCFGEKIYRDYVIETQYECLTHITHRKLEIISSLNSFPLISGCLTSCNRCQDLSYGHFHRSFHF